MIINNFHDVISIINVQVFHQHYYCRYQQYGGTHSYRQNTNITETAMKDSPPRPSITRPARRGASTAPRLRLVRGPLDGAPRPRPGSDSYEARSTGRLDRAPAPRRVFFTYPRTKAIAFNAGTYYHLPAWLRHGPTWEQYPRRVSLFYRPSRDGR
jgi:hypothetical protein